MRKRMAAETRSAIRRRTKLRQHSARVGLWAGDQGLTVGSRVRVRVLARDVSLASAPPSQSSIQNVLQGRVDAIADDDHPGLVLVRAQIGNVMFLSRLTKRAAASLGVVPDQTVWLQVKSVALME